jgi:hypothetical protein
MFARRAILLLAIASFGMTLYLFLDAPVKEPLPPGLEALFALSRAPDADPRLTSAVDTAVRDWHIQREKRESMRELAWGGFMALGFSLYVTSKFIKRDKPPATPVTPPAARSPSQISA